MRQHTDRECQIWRSDMVVWRQQPHPQCQEGEGECGDFPQVCPLQPFPLHQRNSCRDRLSERYISPMPSPGTTPRLSLRKSISASVSWGSWGWETWTQMSSGYSRGHLSTGRCRDRATYIIHGTTDQELFTPLPSERRLRCIWAKRSQYRLLSSSASITAHWPTLALMLRSSI